MNEEIKNGDRVKIHERLATMENQIQTIMSNHLPHLQVELEAIKRTQWWLLTIMIGGLVTFILDLLKDKLF